MTRDEYLKQKAQLTESLKESNEELYLEEMKKLKVAYARSFQKNGPNRDRALDTSLHSEKVEKSTISTTNTRHDDLAVVIPIKLEPFLAQFTEEEQAIIKVASNFPYMSSQEIAERASTSRQKVAAFLDSDRYIEFRARLLQELQDETPIRVFARLERLSKSNDPRVALDASKQLIAFSGMNDKKKEEKDVKDEIKDPVMAEYLRLLGNWAAAGYRDKLVLEPPVEAH